MRTTHYSLLTIQLPPPTLLTYYLLLTTHDCHGKACAAFADGHPLIMGSVIADGWLQVRRKQAVT